MSQYSTLLGVIVGAAVVGAALVAKDVMDDPEKAAAIKEKWNNGYRKVCEKVGEGCATLREKAAEGYAIAKEKATETGEAIREKVSESAPVRRIKEKAEDIRRAAEPASPYFREEEENEASEEPEKTEE